MIPLRQCLLDTVLARLRAIALFWDIELIATRQREGALELAEAMDDPQVVTSVRESLPPEERQALDALLGGGGHMPQRVFAREWGEIRTMGAGRMEREQPWEQPLSPAEGLWYHGLLFRSFEQGPDGAYEAVFVPPEIQAHLPAPAVEGSRIVLEPTPEPPAVFSTADLLVDDACTLLSYVQNQRPRLTSGRQWPQRHQARLRHRLRIADPERFAFLSYLAQSIGWLIEGGSSNLRLEPEAVTTWLKNTPFHQQRALAETWRDDPTWNDLFHIPSLQPEDTGAWRNDPVLARQAILRHLEACAPDTWYRLDAFTAVVREVDPDFQRPSGDYETWYIRDRGTGSYLSGFKSWDAVEGRLIRYVIARPLTWLGLVDLGFDQRAQPGCPGQPPTAFRLTPAGTTFLNLVDPPSPPQPQSSRLGPGFTVSVPATRRYERFQIARVADWLGSGDRFTYQLTPGSLERARKQGISIARVLEFLDEVTDAPIPGTLKAALNHWSTRGTEAWLERAVLLRLANEELMRQATASRQVGHFIKEQLGPTTALVRETDWGQVIAGLEDMGLLPDVIGLADDHKVPR